MADNGVELADDLILEHPEAHAPGNTDILIPSSSIPIIERLQTDRQMRTYLVRAHVSSTYAIAMAPDQVLRCETETRIRLVGGSKKWQIRPFRRPICFNLEPNDEGFLRSVSGYARAELPLVALDLFKSAVNLLLDRLVVLRNTPLYVQRTELHLDSEGHKVIEVTFPPLADTTMEHGGASDLPAFFHAYWSLEREAICAPSSVYRFLCRWRAFESIPRTRAALRAYAESVNCTARMPRVPRLTAEDRRQLRLRRETHGKARNLEDAVRCYSDLRDAVAHFWSTDEKDARKGTILPYRAPDADACEKASQVIRICNGRLVQPLWRFFTQHLSATYGRGQIYATPAQEREFCAAEEALLIYDEDDSAETDD